MAMEPAGNAHSGYTPSLRLSKPGRIFPEVKVWRMLTQQSCTSMLERIAVRRRVLLFGIVSNRPPRSHLSDGWKAEGQHETVNRMTSLQLYGLMSLVHIQLISESQDDNGRQWCQP